MEPVVIVMWLAAGVLAGWVLGSAATRFGRAVRDEVSAKSTWEKSVHTKHYERWRTYLRFAGVTVALLLALWMLIHWPDV